MQHAAASRFNSIVSRPELIGVIVLIGASVLAGCDGSDFIHGFDRHPYGSGAGGSGGVDADGGAGGEATVGVCPAFALSPSFELAPAAPEQPYVRCQTLGPEAGWQGIVIASDGQHIAARTGSGTVRLIATNPWHEVAQIASPLGVLDAAAFTPDGQALAVLSAEMGEVTVWRAADGTRLSTFTAPPASTVDATASSLTYSQDGTRLATSLGALIEISTGAVTSWKTGMPIDTALVINPENLDTGEAIPAMTFTAGDTTLLVDTDYQIGNSPPSTRLELRVAATGKQTLLFDLYARALSGFAISLDRSKLALAITDEGAIGGYDPGLTIRDAATGAFLISDPSFSGTVLGFSPDGSQLFTETDLIVSALAVADLHTASQFSWPDGTFFLGVSPAGDIVGTSPTPPSGGSTNWFDPATGAVVRTVGFSLQQIVWTPDGKLGAGTGDPAALFHLWSEPDGGALCAPAVSGSPAPALASLGAFLDPFVTQMLTSDDGSIVITDPIVLHTHATDWNALNVANVADGSTLRVFGAASDGRSIAISHPSGARLYTTQGPDVAVWCR